MALSYDRVEPCDGRHRRPVTGADRAHDIASANGSVFRTPKHCGCAPCQLRLPHVRRRDYSDVLGSEAI